MGWDWTCPSPATPAGCAFPQKSRKGIVEHGMSGSLASPGAGGIERRTYDHPVWIGKTPRLPMRRASRLQVGKQQLRDGSRSRGNARCSRHRTLRFARLSSGRNALNSPDFTRFDRRPSFCLGKRCSKSSFREGMSTICCTWAANQSWDYSHASSAGKSRRTVVSTQYTHRTRKTLTHLAFLRSTLIPCVRLCGVQARTSFLYAIRWG
jgi:hypothetical protein